MNPDLALISERIKELRQILDISKEDMAKKLNIPVNEYEGYENASLDIPISALYNIAGELHVDPTVLLTGDAPRMSAYTIVRGGKGISIERYPEYSFTSLAFNYISREMEPMLVNLSPEDKEPKLVTHGGQEFNYVTKGVVQVVISGRSFILNAGDSIYFDPKAPHGQRAIGGDAQFLTVINDFAI